eukprot:s4524_g2.t1
MSTQQVQPTDESQLNRKAATKIGHRTRVQVGPASANGDALLPAHMGTEVLQDRLGFVDALKHDISSYLTTGEEPSGGFPASDRLNLGDYLAGRILCYAKPEEDPFEGDEGRWPTSPSSPSELPRPFGAPPAPGSLLWPPRPKYGDVLSAAGGRRYEAPEGPTRFLGTGLNAPTLVRDLCGPVPPPGTGEGSHLPREHHFARGAELGPSFYAINDQCVKPVTLKMSWANRNGLECHSFISHAWIEGDLDGREAALLRGLGERLR